MSVSDLCTLLTSVEERRSLSGTISFVDPKEKEEETHRASFNPVSATKLAVTWNLFAFLSASMTIPTSLLLNCASIPSNALSRLNRKLTFWDAVPEETSLASLVTAWMASIQE